MLINIVKIIKIIFGIVLLLLLTWSGWFIFNNIYAFLAITDRKDADILVIEGWIPNFNVQLALQEFQQHSYKQIVVVSIMLPTEFEMYSKGGLVFDLTENQKLSPKKINKVTVRAYGTPMDGIYAHFELIVNDSVVGEATTDAKLKSYSFDLSNDQDSISKIIIKYANDRHSEREDRNLYIHSLLVDDQLLPARSPYVVYDRSKIDGKKLVRTDLFSEAEVVGDILMQNGLPDSQIVVLNAPKVEYDRTYTTALSVKKWMRNTHTNYPTFNILTESAHARRTLMLYRMALGEQADIGIIASPSANFNSKNWWKTKGGREYVLEQTLKYLYAIFFILPKRFSNALIITEDI